MKDKLLRRIVPAVPLLARTPVAFFLDIADYFIRRRHPEYRHLPPASLRMRIGVGNKLLRNHGVFMEIGRSIIRDLNSKQYLVPGSRVFEIGCGCGRLAMAFSEVLDKTGTYTGMDVDQEMIEWCRKNLSDNGFFFHHADIFSAVYNPDGRPTGSYAFPMAADSASLVVATSVFTHLLYEDFRHYIAESRRVLRPGGHLYVSFFIMDFIGHMLGDRWHFSHRLDNCYVENLRYPEAAVAYDLGTISQILSDNGFSIIEIYRETLPQQTVVARKN